MKGNRKMLVVFGSFVSLVAGLLLTKEAGIYSVFAASVVGAGGWFFKANTDEHKANAP